MLTTISKFPLHDRPEEQRHFNDAILVSDAVLQSHAARPMWAKPTKWVIHLSASRNLLGPFIIYFTMPISTIFEVTAIAIQDEPTGYLHSFWPTDPRKINSPFKKKKI